MKKPSVVEMVGCVSHSVRLLLLWVVVATVVVAHGEGNEGLLAYMDGDAIRMKERFENLTYGDVTASWEGYVPPKGFSLGRKNRDDGTTKTPLEFVTTRYLDSEELHVHMLNFASRCGDIARLVQIGRSVKGRPIEALEISNTLDKGLKDGKPHVKIVGGIHGNEAVGRVVSMGVAEWLCEKYESDPTASAIVSGVHTWVLPGMNPDGFEAKTRWNANGVDLNRDFPDRFDDEGMTSNTLGRQPETVAIMGWTQDYPFVSSLVFHGGELVVSYPFDGTADGRTHYAKSPDDETFRYLAREYAENHRVLSSFRQRQFPGGITNGAAWYPIYGGMGDWNYLMEHVYELTIEAGKTKWPNSKMLPGLFEDNRKSVLEFIKTTAFKGINGVVRTKNRNGSKRALKGAKVYIDGLDSYVISTEKGQFYRPIAPGTYTVLIEKRGYNTVVEEVKCPLANASKRTKFNLVKLQ